MSPRLFVIAGPSGVGKGTLIRLVLERMPALAFATSATTRPILPGEVDGRDYHFLSDEEFRARVERGEFLEHVEFAGHRYGTLRGEVERRLESGRSVVLEIDVPGAREIRRQRPDAVLVFIVPPSLDELESRLRLRGANSPQQVEARLEIASRELEAKPEFQHVIVNDDKHRAADALTRVILAELEESP